MVRVSHKEPSSDKQPNVSTEGLVSNWEGQRTHGKQELYCPSSRDDEGSVLYLCGRLDWCGGGDLGEVSGRLAEALPATTQTRG